MKIKYFIRGLGMGILVTAVVLGISGQSDMSDEDIILRAKNLGMVFQEDITDDAEKPDIVQTPKPTEEATGVPKEAASARHEAEEVTPEAINTNKPAENPAPKTISFTIERGDWSRMVSEKLQKLGVIKDSKEFDKYLVDNGYANKIKVGDFSVEKGADFSEIAKIITQ